MLWILIYLAIDEEDVEDVEDDGDGDDDISFPLKTPTVKEKRLPKEWGGTTPDRVSVQSRFFLDSHTQSNHG